MTDAPQAPERPPRPPLEDAAEFPEHYAGTADAFAVYALWLEEENRRLSELQICGTCGGTPHPSGAVCVCEGKGTVFAETHGLRMVIFDLQRRLARAEGRFD